MNDGPASRPGATGLSRRRDLRYRLESFLFWALVSFAGRWCRVRIVAGGEQLDRLRSEGGVAVLAFWHDRLFFISHFVSSQLMRRGYPVTALVSPSRDGELAARTAMRLGARVVRGSSSRGASQGLRALVRAAASGSGLAVTPDGPRGPAREAKPGVVAVAGMAGAPLLPLSWVADRSWRLGSWDRLEIPKPFARVAVAVGEPQLVARPADGEETARRLADLASAIRELDAVATSALAQAGPWRGSSKTR